jgi:hypothetical protein
MGKSRSVYKIKIMGDDKCITNYREIWEPL